MIGFIESTVADFAYFDEEYKLNAEKIVPSAAAFKYLFKTPPNFTKVDNKPFTTLNFTDLGSPFGGPNEDPPGTPTMSGEAHIGPPTPHESNASTPVSKSAFIELQQHGYGPLRTSYQHHFNSAPGNAHSGPTGAHDAGFHSPRGALGAYPFPPMHQNSYTGYHLGSYAANCPPSPKDDGKYPKCSNWV